MTHCLRMAQGVREYRKHIDQNWRNADIQAKQILLEALEFIPKHVREAPRGQLPAGCATPQEERMKQRMKVQDKDGEAECPAAATATLEAKVASALAERLVFRFNDLPEECDWKQMKDGVRQLAAAANISVRPRNIRVSHKKGESEATVTVLVAGNKESWDQVGGATIQVSDSAVQLNAVQDEQELVEYWTNEFSQEYSVSADLSDANVDAVSN